MAECVCKLCHHHRIEGEALRAEVAALTARAEAAEAKAGRMRYALGTCEWVEHEFAIHTRVDGYCVNWLPVSEDRLEDAAHAAMGEGP